MLHETVIHRGDAELASRQTPVIDPDVAADTIDEFLGNLPSSGRAGQRLGELPTGQSLHLHATDADGEWLIRFTGSGIEWERGHAKASAAVRGRLTLLLLFAYGRIGADDEALEVFGDEAILSSWQEITAL
jgi:predicted lipid carrier protein YhbT